MKKFLILTGPQGSGNHIFARLLSQHPEVAGWEELLDQYWVPHDLEPFAEWWLDPGLVDDFDFSSSDHWVASISVPFVYSGTTKIPQLIPVAEKLRDREIDVHIAIIVRDQNINAEQQRRVRRNVTLPLAVNFYHEQVLTTDFPVTFVDHEAFFLHRKQYLRWLSKVLDFPIAWDSPEIMKFIEQDANHKYVKYVDEHWLDKEVWDGLRPKKERGILE